MDNACLYRRSECFLIRSRAWSHVAQFTARPNLHLVLALVAGERALRGPLRVLNQVLEKAEREPLAHGVRSVSLPYHAANRGIESPSLSYTAGVRVAPFVTFLLTLQAAACGEVSKRRGSDGAAVDAAAGAGGAEVDSGAAQACPDPESSVPDVAPFVPPALNALGSFQVTFRNLCATTVWPAWAPSGGLDNSVIDTQLWLPMLPASDRAATVYGGVREIGFWGRTACDFDQAGLGACLTGDCGGFICAHTVDNFPTNATVFDLRRGFLGGYNVGLRVDGVACGKHQCVTDLATCGAASAVVDSCGGAIACSDACSEAAPECCRQSGSRCNVEQTDHDTDGADDLVLTFCP